MPVKRILLATDLSARSDRALDRACELAVRFQAELVAAHVIQEPAQTYDLSSWRRPADPLEVAQRRMRDDLRTPDDVKLNLVVERGDPAPVLSELVRKLDCDLVVTGVARDEALGRVTLGGTAHALARTAGVPILVVKTRPWGAYRKVVVATDFSAGSRKALETALELFPEAHIILFHAFDVIYESFMNDRFAAREAVAQRARQECEEFIAATPAAAAARQRIEVLCQYGEPGKLLADLSLARKMDLVVLGTQGRSGLARVMLGSVAERLLAGLPGDVLLVRPADA